MPTHLPRLAVVSTHNRPVELARLLDAIAPQCNTVYVIDNASDPPVHLPSIWKAGSQSMTVHLFRDEEQPPNLSRLWNIGIDYIDAMMRAVGITAWDVAVFNDDAVPPPGWWDAVSGAMRATTAVAGCADQFGRYGAGEVQLHDDHAPMAVTTRLAGWAMLLRGEWAGARFDERLRWWFADDLVSLRARQSGGLVHVGGFPVPNTGADTSTVGVLAEQAGRDRATFVGITGRQPW